MKNHLLVIGVLLAGLLARATPAEAHLPDRDASLSVGPSDVDPETDPDAGIAADDGGIGGDDGGGNKDGASGATSHSPDTSDSAGGCSIGRSPSGPGSSARRMVAGSLLAAAGIVRGRSRRRR